MSAIDKNGKIDLSKLDFLPVARKDMQGIMDQIFGDDARYEACKDYRRCEKTKRRVCDSASFTNHDPKVPIKSCVNIVRDGDEDVEELATITMFHKEHKGVIHFKNLEMAEKCRDLVTDIQKKYKAEDEKLVLTGEVERKLLLRIPTDKEEIENSKIWSKIPEKDRVMRDNDSCAILMKIYNEVVNDVEFKDNVRFDKMLLIVSRSHFARVNVGDKIAVHQDDLEDTGNLINFEGRGISIVSCRKVSTLDVNKEGELKPDIASIFEEFSHRKLLDKGDQILGMLLKCFGDDEWGEMQKERHLAAKGDNECAGVPEYGTVVKLFDDEERKIIGDITGSLICVAKITGTSFEGSVTTNYVMLTKDNRGVCEPEMDEPLEEGDTIAFLGVPTEMICQIDKIKAREFAVFKLIKIEND